MVHLSAGAYDLGYNTTATVSNRSIGHIEEKKLPKKQLRAIKVGGLRRSS